MNSIPDEIDITNIKLKYDNDYICNFEKINYDRLKNLLRSEIYVLILSREREDIYYDIELFSTRNHAHEVVDKLVTELRQELKNIGWKTCLSYGDTGLFIYSTEDKPNNCW